MLFLKYISDVWKDKYAALMAQYDNDETRAKRQLRYERFILPEGADYDTLYEQRNEANLGELINIALEKIEDANKEKLENVALWDFLVLTLSVVYEIYYKNGHVFAQNRNYSGG